MSKFNDNEHFYQFNKLAPKILLNISAEKPSAISVYMLLVELSNQYGCCIVPQAEIANEVGKSPRTVARLLNYLAIRHYIAIARSGRANVYILNYNLIWQTSRNLKGGLSKHIKFPTNVVLTKDENPEFFNKLNKFIKKNGHKSIPLNDLKQKNVKPNAKPRKSKLGNRSNIMSSGMAQSGQGRYKSNSKKLSTSKRDAAYKFIVKHTNRDNILEITQRQLAKRLNVSITTVEKAIKTLRMYNYINIKPGKIMVNPEVKSSKDDEFKELILKFKSFGKENGHTPVKDVNRKASDNQSKIKSQQDNN